MATHNRLGAWGEELAREYLLTRGYAIDCVNARIGNVEIDFIARKDDRIIFVEVKTRSTAYVDPLDAIDDNKRRRLIRAADTYMRSLPESGALSLQPQFDFILIVGTPDSSHTLEHIPDAFYP